jgi:hypothetical protein
MTHKLAIAVGVAAAAGVLAAALTAGGFTPYQRMAAAQEAVTAPDTGQTADTTTKTVVDNVYVLPKPKQQVIHVTKPAPPAAAAPAPKVVVLKQRSGGDDERDGGEGHEGGSGHRGGGD